MNIKPLVLVLALPVLTPTVFSQEVGGSSETANTQETSSENDAVPDLDMEEKKKDKSDPRELILLFGIESDVINLLETLVKEKIADYNDLLAEIAGDTGNPRILESVFRLWEETLYSEGIPHAHNELNKILEDADYTESVSLSAISYLSTMKDEGAAQTLLDLSRVQEGAIAAASVRALGNIGLNENAEDARQLLSRLKELDRDAENNLAVALIITLGELRFEPAADELVYIIEDAVSSAEQRRAACISVGKIGRESDALIIERIYQDSAADAVFRAYALAGLAEFPDYDAVPLLIQALKRDSYWRIRVNAAEKLVNQNSREVQELLRYKAENDPIKQVRVAAMIALASSSDSESHKFLLNYYTNEKFNPKSRLACLKALIEYKIPGTSKAIEEVMAKLWEKDQERFLEFTFLELSMAKWPELSPIYERMLAHNNWLLVVYSIRGIRNNGIALEDEINALDTEGVDGRIRREIERTQ